jgi:solute carrier family 35 protein C2
MGEVAFDSIGFILVLSASILSGMRWTVVQLKLQSFEPRLKSTIAVMRILSPFMFLSMLSLSFIFEKPWTRFGHHENNGSSATTTKVNIASGSDSTSGGVDKSSISFFDTPKDILWTLGLGMIGAVLAICMIICEFYLIMKSSAVVLMIGGVLKELTTIMIGVAIMGDQLNTVNSLGCVVVFSGVMLYKISHHLESREKVYDSIDIAENEVSDTAILFAQEDSIDRNDTDPAHGTINKRRKGMRITTMDQQETSQRPLVEGKEGELT